MIRMRYLALGVLAVLAGCSSSSTIPEDRFFEIEITAPAKMLRIPVLNGGLAVEPVLADPMRGGRAIVYRQNGSPLELRRYHYEFWVEEPPEMLRQALVGYLDRFGVADAVEDGNLRADTDYSLRVRLLRFEHLVGSVPSVFEVEVAVTLYSEGANSVLLNKIYRQNHETREDDMHTVAEAMQAALDSIFHSMATDIGALNPSL